MKWPLSFAVLLLFRPLLGMSQVPYDPINGRRPSFTIQHFDYPYAGSYESIRAVSFQNFTFPRFDHQGKILEWVSLKNGCYKHNQAYVHSETSIESVHYLSGPNSPEPGSALVLLSWFGGGGSSSQDGVAYVLTVSNGKLRLIQAMDWDTHFQTNQPKESFDASTSTLVFRASHYIPGDANCCVSAMDVVTLRWDGAGFARTGFNTEPSEYGKSQGKRLPH